MYAGWNGIAPIINVCPYSKDWWLWNTFMVDYSFDQIGKFALVNTLQHANILILVWVSSIFNEMFKYSSLVSNP
jgi:hypothetical protein